MEKIWNFMEKEPKYKGSIKVVHFLEVLKELGWKKVSDKVEKPLKGLKILPYYGCLLLRPRGFGIDNPDNPNIMEELLYALGAEVIDTPLPFKSKCCGAYQVVHMKNVVSQLSYGILQKAVEAGADMLATSCPLCEFNLGERQKDIQNLFRGFNEIPVIYYSQLMALAFKLKENKIGLDYNYPNPRPLLRKKGLL
jgi:heterodisulfide reductase subunit B